MYDFLNVFSSPEYILADLKCLISVFVTVFKKQDSCQFFPLSH